jgi:hypothetical protein
MHPWVLPWLIVTIVTTLVVTVMVIGLVRHVLVLVRTVGQFQREAQPITDELARKSARAADRAASIQRGLPGRS